MESRLVEEWLARKRGWRVRMTVPRRGQPRRQLLMAEENARLADTEGACFGDC